MAQWAAAAHAGCGIGGRPFAWGHGGGATLESAAAWWSRRRRTDAAARTSKPACAALARSGRPRPDVRGHRCPDPQAMPPDLQSASQTHGAATSWVSLNGSLAASFGRTQSKRASSRGRCRQLCPMPDALVDTWQGPTPSAQVGAQIDDSLNQKLDKMATNDRFSDLLWMPHSQHKVSKISDSPSYHMNIRRHRVGISYDSLCRSGLENLGFHQIAKMKEINIDKYLISALVERW
uniref:Uncharacterized protein n=1 Tax=Leersia perrieri TaxID=77586 RepID=A0A0D9X138_9ORYZ